LAVAEYLNDEFYVFILTAYVLSTETVRMSTNKLLQGVELLIESAPFSLIHKVCLCGLSTFPKNKNLFPSWEKAACVVAVLKFQVCAGR